MADGTVYRNLYYGQDWEELSYYSESNAPTILFYVKSKGAFKELELQTEEITEINRGGETCSRFSMYYSPAYKRVVVANDELEDEWWEDDFPYHPKLIEVNDIAEQIFEEVLVKYKIDEDERFMIIDNLIAIVLGYMETTMGLDNIEPPAVFAHGYVIALLTAAYACDKIESDEGYKYLLKDVAAIVPEVSEYIEARKDKINIKIIQDDNASE